MKNILIINSSYRKTGNSKLVSDIYSQTLNFNNNINIEEIFLIDYNIERCIGCTNCLTIGEEFCPYKKDDIQKLKKKMLEADGIIFISPVYAMNMTAIMKNFMDRLAYTMHRPEFFKQKTAIIAVTGAVGIKETTNSIAQFKYSGFDIIQTFGIIAENALKNPKLTDKKTIYKIKKQAKFFLKHINENKPIKPNLVNVIQFSMQQKFFQKLPNTSADWKFYNKHRWFDKNKAYYIDEANISFFKKIIAKLFSIL